ncbi:FAD-binding protein [Sulfurimonas sediminis]|uniref:FAD-binding protein n=1 Tax=Sulfurimonas sediminis TaxID=2590020 RepID=A0A7M1B1F9_9BACT|nr:MULTISPECIES: NAD(P)-binding domain-containing protein [Sulfurimonas]QOP43561.1 FAD-binding protein [Sulfurimonas sediminis]UCN01502.1 NAD(P)-binding domain-containing protein [Sulfurimonas sp. SWIR-19]
MAQNNPKTVDLAIIGAGPGGMAAAIEAKLAGIENVMVIDKAPHHNDMIHKFYKKGKRVDKDWMGIKFEFTGNVTFEECSKEDYIQQMNDKLSEAGVLDKFEYNHEIIRIEKEEDGLFSIVYATDGIAEALENMRAKNVILSVGRMGKPNKPKYKFPKELKSVLNFNLSKVQNGEHVMIVGGGDTAGEYAYGLIEMEGMEDCVVTLNYRQAEIKRMNPINTQMCMKYLDNGKLINKLGVDVASVEPGTERAIKVNFTDGTTGEYDRAVYALGGTTPKDILVNSGVKTGEWDVPVYDEKTFETNVKGLYTIGDVVTDQGSIALAFNHASDAVKDIASKLK